MQADIDVVHVGAVLLQGVSTLELLLAHVARMPPNSDVVYKSLMTLQITLVFEFLLAYFAS